MADRHGERPSQYYAARVHVLHTGSACGVWVVAIRIPPASIAPRPSAVAVSLSVDNTHGNIWLARERGAVASCR